MEHISADTMASNIPLFLEHLKFKDLVDTRGVVKDFLLREGVDIQAVKRMPVQLRSLFLIEELIHRCEPIPETPTGRTYEAPSELGLIIIKPEILPEANQVVDFLEKSGIHSELLDPVLPSKVEWLDTYGYMLARYPDVINIYIMQRALGVQPLLFEHLDVSAYASMASGRDQNSINTDDRDMLFDRLFCGQAEKGSTQTIRSSVSLPIMQHLGFETFTGYAAGFDPYQFYQDGGATNIFRAYNGVHIPSDKFEKARNFNSYVKQSND